MTRSFLLRCAQASRHQGGVAMAVLSGAASGMGENKRREKEMAAKRAALALRAGQGGQRAERRCHFAPYSIA